MGKRPSVLKKQVEKASNLVSVTKVSVDSLAAL